MNRTSQEALERMEGLLRRMAAGIGAHTISQGGIGCVELEKEAREIVAMLPEPVDPDREEACKVVASMKDYMFANMSQAEEVAFRAIKRGRELQRAEWMKYD